MYAIYVDGKSSGKMVSNLLRNKYSDMIGI